MQRLASCMLNARCTSAAWVREGDDELTRGCKSPWAACCAPAGRSRPTPRHISKGAHMIAQLERRSHKNLRARLIARAWHDMDFKSKLLGNPKAAIEQEFGIELPAD